MKGFFSIFLFSTFLHANNIRTKEITKDLISPCCWAGTVYDLDHNPEIEEQVERFLAQGKTKQEILDYYVGIYGERVLAIPKAEGFNVMVWITPALAAIFGLLILAFYLRLSNPNKITVSSELSTIPFDNEIEKELREMD